jgi:hypothetical protein
MQVTTVLTLHLTKTQGWASSNTAYIIFDEVRVPASNIIGQENQGFLAIMLNFNHERLAGIIMGVRGCRMCIEESINVCHCDCIGLHWPMHRLTGAVRTHTFFLSLSHALCSMPVIVLHSASD